jgi:hypothetical protein
MAEDRRQRTQGRIGKPGDQHDKVQVTRITGNQDATELVLFLSRILYKSPPCVAKQSQFAGGAKFR